VASNSASFAQQTGAPWVWLDEVEVADSPAKSAIAAFGDSITDGYLIPEESNKTWPDVLASHLSSAGIHEGVINAGISGNRLLHNGQGAPFGIAALARFDSDVLAQPNVKYVIVLLGINDIGQVDDNSPDVVNAQDIENGLTQLAERAHEHGMKIYAATLTPFKVTTIKNYYSDIKEVKRQAVNSWIRTNTIFDGFIDFDKAIDDPQNPGQMIPADDSGDHLHPNADGDTAMGKAIPLSWFK
jgi:lysophospholipase L1-like esterase